MSGVGIGLPQGLGGLTRSPVIHMHTRESSLHDLNDESHHDRLGEDG